MAYVNVNRSLNDQFYRYKMPKLIAKVEGKGNGIKTVIVNMSDIAKALSRPPTYPTKYFGCELGSQTQFDVKKDRYIVNGQHDANKLQDILDGFIKKYVLCASCDNPETVLTVLPKRAIITTACKACGHSGQLETNHKLNTFILKNPPESTAKKQDAKTPKKDKTSKKSLGKEGDSPNNSANEEADGEIKAKAGDGNDFNDRDEDDDDWAEDTSVEAVQRRMQELTAGAKTLMLDADTNKSEEERINIFYKFVKERLPITAVKYKELVAEAGRLEIKDKAVMVLCELILNADAIKLIKAHAPLLLYLTQDNKKAQKYLLGGVEQTIKLHKDALLPKTSVLLKTLYDEDIVEEDQMIEWSKKVSKRYVGKEFAPLIHEKAQPFIEWLKQAEEESEDAESDEDAVEIEYDDRHTAGGLREVKEASPQKTGSYAANTNELKNGHTVIGDDDDEIDIDDI